ncbi:MAG: TIGR03564 family F420-dependent LLM class oxidoreductase [Acidimicrobiales bacterium]
MRIGLFLGDLVFRSTDDVIAGIKRADSEGFASAFLPQVFGWDSLTLLAVAGREAANIELGTAVVPTYPRHPVALAGQAATVNSLTGGRLALGIGVSHAPVIEGSLGYSFERPAHHMKEYLSALLPLMRGEAAKVDGDTVKVNAKLGNPPTAPPQVLLAALAPHMLGLAGSVADGTITWMVGPKVLKSHTAPRINAAAEKAGRDAAPRVVVGVPVCVTDDAAAARERAAKTFAMYGTLPVYRSQLDAEGYAGPGDAAVVGNEEQVTEALEACLAAGGTELIATLFGGPDDKERSRALLANLNRG